MTEKTYWIVRWKDTSYSRGTSSVLGPKLYSSEKLARAKVRNRYRKETDAEQDVNKEFVEVKLVEVGK